MTGEINLRKLALDRKIPYNKLWRKVNLSHLTPQDAINKIEMERLEGEPSRTLLKDPRLKEAKEYVKLYCITLKDAVRALKEVPKYYDNSPIFLGWPLSYWIHNNTEYNIILHMLGNNYSMEEIIEITGIRLKLHYKIRRKR